MANGFFISIKFHSIQIARYSITSKRLHATIFMLHASANVKSHFNKKCTSILDIQMSLPNYMKAGLLYNHMYTSLLIEGLNRT